VEVSAVRGDRHVEAVQLKPSTVEGAPDRDGDGDGDGDGAKREAAPPELAVNAVFVFIGAEPGAPWLPDAVARDKLGYILTGPDAKNGGRWPVTDREPCPLETTIPGVLAAGDIRAGSTKRVGFAVGDGSLAVTCCHKLRAISA
jgi:thioredoxin reductase (NADPH)